ncbi:hypothetical protein EHO60_16135 [Leptospira fletcheri]|uniref:Lipoprotein n=1 Tax=Leptospira fletcheri TaxID=2484981 RepID=A0A4R9G4R5_9LEPT|nr:hypothetical protein [Leptospira fletcheri]TGK06125.1 hypothetical protein EHO60_16135 [Leptospira fletcheri]
MKFILSIFSILFIGCVSNPYVEFYSDHSAGRHKPNQILASSNKEPELRSYSTDPVNDDLRMVENGYMVVGESSFKATPNKIWSGDLRDAAFEFDAEIVLFGSRFDHSYSYSSSNFVYGTALTPAGRTISYQGYQPSV